MKLKEVIERNSQKLMGLTFLFLGVYDSEGKPLLISKKPSFSEEKVEKIPYILFGSIQLFKTLDKSGEKGNTVIVERDEYFYVISRGEYKGIPLYVVYAVEKGWFIFSSVERAVKKTKEFLKAIRTTE